MQAKTTDSVRTLQVKGLVHDMICDACESGFSHRQGVMVTARKPARHSGITVFDVSVNDDSVLSGAGVQSLTMFLFGFMLSQRVK